MLSSNCPSGSRLVRHRLALAMSTAVAVAMGAMAGTAEAVQVATKSTAVGTGYTVDIKVNSGYKAGTTINNQALTSFDTRYYASESGGAVLEQKLTFCVDLFINNANRIDTADDTVFGGSAYDYSMNPNSSTPNGYERNIGAAGWLVNRYADTSSGNWSSITTGLSGVTQKQQYAALQVAIWKAAFDSGSTQLNAGNFVFTDLNNNVKTMAQALLTARGTKTEQTGWINYVPPLMFGETEKNQDMVYAVQPVPEPSTLALAGMAGLVGLGYGLRRARRRDA